MNEKIRNVNRLYRWIKKNKINNAVTMAQILRSETINGYIDEYCEVLEMLKEQRRIKLDNFYRNNDPDIANEKFIWWKCNRISVLDDDEDGSVIKWRAIKAGKKDPITITPSENNAIQL